MKISFLKYLLLLFLLNCNVDASAQKGEPLNLFSIENIVSITQEQKSVLLKAYNNLSLFQDSLRNSAVDPECFFQSLYEARRNCHNILVKTLSNAQFVKFIKASCAPEVNAKSDYYLSLLRLMNKYTEAELCVFKEEIYNFLMLEKIAYVKYKYDYGKQKENIGRLKAVKPKSLQESLNIEKQTSMEKIRNGRVLW